MIPTDTKYGRHAVRVLHEFYDLPVEWWNADDREWQACAYEPQWAWYCGTTYRIQPYALRKWMEGGEYLTVGLSGSVTLSFSVDLGRCLAFWHRSEIIDDEPERTPEEVAQLRKLARLGVGE